MISDKEFAILHNVTKKTVHVWFEKGYLPGAKFDSKTKTIQIPNETLRPYNPRAKEPKALYSSIIKACSENCSVFPTMYKIPKERFNVYLKELVQAGLIEPYFTQGGFTQFAPTLKSKEFIMCDKAEQLQIIKGIVEAGTQGITTAALNKFFPAT